MTTFSNFRSIQSPSSFGISSSFDVFTEDLKKLGTAGHDKLCIREYGNYSGKYYLTTTSSSILDRFPFRWIRYFYKPTEERLDEITRFAIDFFSAHLSLLEKNYAGFEHISALLQKGASRSQDWKLEREYKILARRVNAQKEKNKAAYSNLPQIELDEQALPQKQQELEQFRIKKEQEIQQEVLNKSVKTDLVISNLMQQAHREGKQIQKTVLNEIPAAIQRIEDEYNSWIAPVEERLHNERINQAVKQDQIEREYEKAKRLIEEGVPAYVTKIKKGLRTNKDEKNQLEQRISQDLQQACNTLIKYQNSFLLAPISVLRSLFRKKSQTEINWQEKHLKPGSPQELAAFQKNNKLIRYSYELNLSSELAIPPHLMQIFLQGMICPDLMQQELPHLKFQDLLHLSQLAEFWLQPQFISIIFSSIQWDDDKKIAFLNFYASMSDCEKLFDRMSQEYVVVLPLLKLHCLTSGALFLYLKYCYKSLFPSCQKFDPSIFQLKSFSLVLHAFVQNPEIILQTDFKDQDEVILLDLNLCLNLYKFYYNQFIPEKYAKKAKELPKTQKLLFQKTTEMKEAQILTCKIASLLTPGNVSFVYQELDSFFEKEAFASSRLHQAIVDFTVSNCSAIQTPSNQNSLGMSSAFLIQMVNKGFVKLDSWTPDSIVFWLSQLRAQYSYARFEFSTDKPIMDAYHFAAQHFDKLIENKTFLQLEHGALIDILKFSAIPLSEKELFDAVIQWIQHNYTSPLFDKILNHAPGNCFVENTQTNLIQQIRLDHIDKAYIKKMSQQNILKDTVHAELVSFLQNNYRCRFTFSTQSSDPNTIQIQWKIEDPDTHLCHSNHHTLSPVIQLGKYRFQLLFGHVPTQSSQIEIVSLNKKEFETSKSHLSISGILNDILMEEGSRRLADTGNKYALKFEGTYDILNLQKSISLDLTLTIKN